MLTEKVCASRSQPLVNAAGKKYTTTGPSASALSSENGNGSPARLAVAENSGAVAPTSSAATAGPVSNTASAPSAAAKRERRFMASSSNRSPLYGHWRYDLRSEEHTSELQSRFDLVCRLLLEKKKTKEQ